MWRPALLLSALLAAAGPRPVAAGLPPEFSDVVVAGPFSLPTAFAYAPDGRLFVAEKSGLVWVVPPGGAPIVWLDLRFETNEFGDRGLIGLALDPLFSTDAWVYLAHILEPDLQDPDQATPAFGEVFRIRALAADENTADPATRQTLLSGFDNHHYSHAGGCLRFDDAGNLLASFGDGSSYNEVDPLALATFDLDRIEGKIVRVDRATAAGVPGNPYYDPAAPGVTRSKVLAFGFRNPFRFGIAPGSGDLYVGDVGWGEWEEVNRVSLAWSNPDHDQNYGWPCYEGRTGVSNPQFEYQTNPGTAPTCGTIYSSADGGTGVGATPALYSYNHSDPGGENGSAVIGGAFYTGGAGYPVALEGRFFFGDYARDRIQTLTIGGSAEDFGTPGDWGGPVDIQRAPDGRIAYLRIYDGTLREIVFTGANRPPVAVATASPTDGPPGLRVKFDGSASFDPDGARVRFNWDFGDGRHPSHSRRPRHRFTTAATYYTTLTVSDARTGGLTDQLTLQVNVGNTAPVVRFATLSDGQSYRVGDVLPVTIAAGDIEDGVLSGAQVTWRVLLHHLGHLHFLVEQEGTSGSIVVPDHGDDSFLSLEATAADSLGARTTVRVALAPTTAPITLTSTPSGATIVVDGQAHTTPYAWSSVVGGHHVVTAVTPQTIGGVPRTFAAWSDGQAASHGFTTPTDPLSLAVTFTP